MRSTLLIILISSFFTLNLLGGDFIFSLNCKKAISELFEFNFEKAKSHLENEKKQAPDNLMVYYVENYIDFIETLIDGGEKRFSKYKNNFEARLKLLKNGDENNPFYLFVLSELYLQTTLLNGQFKEFVNAGLNFYRSYKFTNQNIVKFPDFIFNKKLKGIHELLMSIIPDEYENIFSFFGFVGTSEKGMKLIDEYYKYAKNIEGLEVEAVMFKYFTISQFGKDDQSPFEFLDSHDYNKSENIVIKLCYLLAIKESGDNNNKALNYIEQKNLKPEKYNIPHLYYLIGSLKFTRLDDDSNEYFENFLKYYHGGHFIKHTNRKLAVYYYLHDNYEKYRFYLDKVFNEGLALVEHDRQAEYELSDTVKLSKTLLKTRYLFEGGYFSRALKMLADHSGEFKKCPLKHQVEYFYWYGKIYDHLGDYEKAKKYYNYTLRFGKTLTQYFFVPDAALRLGLILEKEGNFEGSREQFKYCLSNIKRTYYSSIDRNAKIALERVEKVLDKRK